MKHLSKENLSSCLKVLNLNHDVFTKRNHKGLIVQKFHQFLNKCVILSLKSVVPIKFVFLLASPQATLRIARQSTVPTFFAVFQVSVGNFTIPSIYIYIYQCIAQTNTE